MSSSYGSPTLATVHAVRVDIHDVDFVAQPEQYLLSYVELTAPRQITLPDAGVVPIGKMYVVKDETGIAHIHNITIKGFGDPGSEQPIDGLTTGAIINTIRGALTLVSTGVSWYIV